MNYEKVIEKILTIIFGPEHIDFMDEEKSEIMKILMEAFPDDAP